MSEEDVYRLASAIAKANGHSDTDVYAKAVVEAWLALGAPAEPAKEGE